MYHHPLHPYIPFYIFTKLHGFFLALVATVSLYNQSAALAAIRSNNSFSQDAQDASCFLIRITYVRHGRINMSKWLEQTSSEVERACHHITAYSRRGLRSTRYGRHWALEAPNGPDSTRLLERLDLGVGPTRLTSALEAAESCAGVSCSSRNDHTSSCRPVGLSSTDCTPVRQRWRESIIIAFYYRHELKGATPLSHATVETLRTDGLVIRYSHHGPSRPMPVLPEGIREIRNAKAKSNERSLRSSRSCWIIQSCVRECNFRSPLRLQVTSHAPMKDGSLACGVRPVYHQSIRVWSQKSICSFGGNMSFQKMREDHNVIQRLQQEKGLTMGMVSCEARGWGD